MKEELKTKGYVATTMTFYAVTYAELSRVARDKGYALALHGSLSRDMDVIAVPWVKDAAPEDELVKAICESMGGVVEQNRMLKRPHGRHSWVLLFMGCSKIVKSTERATYIDLSVMPLRKKK